MKLTKTGAEQPQTSKKIDVKSIATEDCASSADQQHPLCVVCRNREKGKNS